MKKLYMLGLTALTLAPGLAMATPAAGSYDVSEALPYFVGLIAAITVIGGAKLGPAALAVGFKWIKATIFS